MTRSFIYNRLVLLPASVLNQLCKQYKHCRFERLYLNNASTIQAPKSFIVYSAKYSIWKQHKCRSSWVYCWRRKLVCAKLGIDLQRLEHNLKFSLALRCLESRFWHRSQSYACFKCTKRKICQNSTSSDSVYRSSGSSCNVFCLNKIHKTKSHFVSLEKNLARYTCLTKGETICIKVADRAYMLDILVNLNSKVFVSYELNLLGNKTRQSNKLYLCHRSRCWSRLCASFRLQRTWT